jgi:TetR/AcrR family transcriptional repressor of bet genes
MRKSIEEIRRGELIEGAYRAFVKFGLGGLTSARISREVGMSPGILNYYFKSKDEILFWMIRYANRLIMQEVVRGLSVATTRWDRIMAILEGNFPDHMFDVRTASAWVSFFSAVPQKRQFARLQALFYRRLESNLGSSLEGVLSHEESRRLFLGISVLIDGLWLRRSLSDDVLTREDAIALIRLHVERHLGSDVVAQLKRSQVA